MTTKVLFVDDEINVLSGLRRMLRNQRSVWEMHFANGGVEALELLEKETFDVIVSDMRMPIIDGAELLTRVSQLYPNTVRLVLSGQSEHEKILRAVGPAHQFMSKPCDPDSLIKTIERACGLRSQLQDDSLKDLISQLSTLPSLPKIYRELVAELESDDASLNRIAQKIGSDIGMTAKVLQLVNSSFFGLPQHVSCPKHAVSLLGLNVIRPLVLTANAFSQFQESNVPGFSLDRLLEHSLAVATTAKRIAEKESNQASTVDDSFIAGMLHDIGKLVLAANLPTQYSEAIRIAKDEAIPLWQAETRVFRSSHAEVGAHLLGLWGLPNPIVEAVAFHHRPADSCSECFTPLTAVYVANLVRHSQPIDGDAATDEMPDRQYLTMIKEGDRLEHWDSLFHMELAP
ncbi:response regulator [Stieleria varia]|uniref:Hydrogenase transcriptional regulatory protein hupR1 n=1 Tax=Stieleria varia TaxID=2528005 RepID=A0A5C5ZPN1_9BACT|nr:response regulator [Stieleria varia]TWT89472.1 Hydrogenase transcriptional regulatory protein hupR1 [Stieleria varia]